MNNLSQTSSTSSLASQLEEAALDRSGESTAVPRQDSSTRPVSTGLVGAPLPGTQSEIAQVVTTFAAESSGTRAPGASHSQGTARGQQSMQPLRRRSLAESSRPASRGATGSTSRGPGEDEEVEDSPSSIRTQNPLHEALPPTYQEADPHPHASALPNQGFLQINEQESSGPPPTYTQVARNSERYIDSNLVEGLAESESGSEASSEQSLLPPLTHNPVQTLDMVGQSVMDRLPGFFQSMRQGAPAEIAPGPVAPPPRRRNLFSHPLNPQARAEHRLREVIAAGDSSLARNMLSSGVRPDAQSRTNRHNAFHKAALSTGFPAGTLNGFATEMLESISHQNRFTAVHAPDRTGTSPLQMARAQRDEAMRQQAEPGLSPDAHQRSEQLADNLNGLVGAMTPYDLQSREDGAADMLRATVRSGRVDLVQNMLARGARPDIQAENSRYNAFHEAALTSRFLSGTLNGITDELLNAVPVQNRAAAVQAQDHAGISPIQHARHQLNRVRREQRSPDLDAMGQGRREHLANNLQGLMDVIEPFDPEAAEAERLREGVWRGDVPRVQTMLSRGANPAMQSRPYRQNAFHQASGGTPFPPESLGGITEQMLANVPERERTAAVHAPDRNGETPVEQAESAFEEADFSRMEEGLMPDEHQRRRDQADNIRGLVDGMRPWHDVEHRLQAGIASGDVPLVQTMLSRGARPDRPIGISDRNAFHELLRSTQMPPEILHDLLENVPEGDQPTAVRFQNRDGNSPLHLASAQLGRARRRQMEPNLSQMEQQQRNQQVNNLQPVVDTMAERARQVREPLLNFFNRTPSQVESEAFLASPTDSEPELP